MKRKLFSKENIEKIIKRIERIKRTRSLIAISTGIPAIDKDRRGLEAEEKALRAAVFWKRKKIIRSFRKTKGLSFEDREMKDLILTLLDGREISIQIKNYCDFFVIKRCRDKGVLPFIIWPDEDENIAKERMLNLIFWAYISGLESFQLRQVIAKILEIRKQPKKLNHIMKALFRFWKVI